MKKLFCILIMIASCKEVYNPPVKNANLNYLVVEGNIVAGNDSTFIYLSRSVPVSDTSIISPETNATVNVESDGGETYSLQNEHNGIYFSVPLNISQDKNYRLHIFTADGKEYASDYVPVKQTPPIDSISWKADDNGLTVYANAHDATGNTQYYRWKYVATWEYHARQNSVLIFDPSINFLRSRTPEEQVYRCWKIDTSNNIIITSTTGLSSDVVFERPLVHIPYASQEVSVVYSIIVTQYALTKGAYEFWENLQKNTEQIGSIFDPQPFADYGNFHCITNPAEHVLGYASASSTQQQRIYIFWSQVQWPFVFPNCDDTIVPQDKVIEVFSHEVYLPVHPIASPPGAVLGDLKECVDCRLNGGGVTAKPPYMP